MAASSKVPHKVFFKECGLSVLVSDRLKGHDVLFEKVCFIPQVCDQLLFWGFGYQLLVFHILRPLT